VRRELEKGSSLSPSLEKGERSEGYSVAKRSQFSPKERGKRHYSPCSNAKETDSKGAQRTKEEGRAPLPGEKESKTKKRRHAPISLIYGKRGGKGKSLPFSRRQESASRRHLFSDSHRKRGPLEKGEGGVKETKEEGHHQFFLGKKGRRGREGPLSIAREGDIVNKTLKRRSTFQRTPCTMHVGAGAGGGWEKEASPLRGKGKEGK